MTAKSHWEQVYTSRTTTNVSWYQEHAEESLRLIQESGINRMAPVIDVGGGASTLVDDLLQAGYREVSVLDLSATALAAARRRLGAQAGRVRWIEGDITEVQLPREHFQLWHDRAVFHFLIDPRQRAAYVEQVMQAVRPGGYVIVATFGEDGPLQCSGLPVRRYQAHELHGEFGDAFTLLRHRKESHRTPAGAVQQFVYCYCRKAHRPVG